MSRTLRPILDAAAGNVLAMIALHQDRPCPTNGEIRDWTGVARRRLAAFLAGLVARGIIEIEIDTRRPPCRRMRSIGGVWTGWTSRGDHPARVLPADASDRMRALIERHRDRPCPTVVEIADALGVARRSIAPFLVRLMAGGIIEIESVGTHMRVRRMRAVGGRWTGWTAGYRLS